MHSDHVHPLPRWRDVFVPHFQASRLGPDAAVVAHRPQLLQCVSSLPIVLAHDDQAAVCPVSVDDLEISDPLDAHPAAEAENIAAGKARPHVPHPQLRPKACGWAPAGGARMRHASKQNLEHHAINHDRYSQVIHD